MELTNPAASARSKRLYAYLTRNFGRTILLAQQENPGRMRSDSEMDFLLKTTGHLPAIRGLDFIHNDFAGVVDRAERWNDRGGIVSICWHTGVNGIGYPESKDETPDFARLLEKGTPEHQHLLTRWSQAAEALAQLRDHDIPVLWRPFHEFDGQWFWWGKAGGEAFQKLWRLMYDTFTHEYALNNLIWVLGYADDVLDGWYPGDDVCDILGSDTYRGETTHKSAFLRLQHLNAQKPLAFHECGKLPAPDAFFADEAVWSWVMPWHGKWLTEDNAEERIRAVYGDERYITLDRMEKF